VSTPTVNPWAPNRWNETDRRIGMYSAISVVVLAMVYLITGLIGVVARPADSGTLHQVDPYLAILESLIILSAVALVVMMVSVFAYAPPGRKTYALVALAFMIIFAMLTCSLHFVALTVVRRIGAQLGPELSRQLSFPGGGEWPSLAMAVELLAWDFFFGLSMLFASRVFSSRQPPSRLQKYVRAGMTLSGTLCVLATLGPLTGEMWIAWLGIAGYALILPVSCIFLAALFARTPAATDVESPHPPLD